MTKEYFNEEKEQEQPAVQESQVAQQILNTEQKPTTPQINPTIIDANIQNKYFKILPNGDITFGDYDAGQGIKWDQATQTLDILGGLTVDHLDIPDTTTANSFHVDVDGNVWWGATTIGSAVAKVEKTGKATFTDIVATGTINAQSGYLGNGVYIDTVNGLLVESEGLNVGTAGHIRGGQTDYFTGTGFFLGYSGGAYKFSIGSSTQYLKWDGTNLTVTGLGRMDKIAGDLLYKSADTGRISSDGAYTKYKEIQVFKGGTYRIKFTMNRGGAGGTVYGRIYRNGVAIGTEQTESTGFSVVFSEDIAGWSPGDLIQLYTYKGTAVSSTISNFRIYTVDYDLATVILD